MRLALLVVAMLMAAPAGPPVVPDVRAELVQIDVVVTDAEGQPVRGLGRADFEVLEDGRPQRVAHFLVAPAEPPGPGRRVVVLVDDLHIARRGLEDVKQALRRLVAEIVSSDDEVALVTTASGPVQPLTRDRAVLGQAIQRLSLHDVALPPSHGAWMSAAQAELVLRGDRNARRLAARVLVDEPGSSFDATTPRAALDAARGGSPAASIGTEAERAAEKEVERQARAVLAEALRFSSVSLGAIEGTLRGLGGAPGRKICLLVSDGFLVGAGTSEERTRDLQRVVDAATRSGTVVYALDTRGLVPSGGDAGVEGFAAAPAVLVAGVERQGEQLHRDTLLRLATDTGGFLVRGTSDFARGLRRMLDDDGAYYLLAYEPANPKRDGRFRRIEVRLPGRRALTVRTRRGYFAPDDRKTASRDKTSAPPAPRAPEPGAIEEAAARAALAAPISPGGIPVRLSADYVDLPPAGPQALIRAHVDLGRVRWQEAAGRHRAVVELAGGVYDADGHLVGAPFGRAAELDLDAAAYRRAIEAGLQYQQHVELRPGRYQVRLVAREKTDAQSGGAAEWIEIPDLAEKKLAMSGVFVSSSSSASGASPQRRFKHDDTLSFQIYVYNPRVDDKGASDVVLQAQIWSGGKTIAASRPRPVALQTRDGTPVPETNEMPLEGLAPGPYELRVVVVDRKADATVFRKVEFTVE